MKWQGIRAFAVLFSASIVLQIFRLMVFALTFCSGVLIQTIFYYFQLHCYETVSPVGLESLITLIFVAIGASIAVDRLKDSYASINCVAIKHPILFFTVPNIICCLMFLFCFGFISCQFFTVPFKDFGILNKNLHTTGVYILCASFIVYVVTAICYKDRNFIRYQIEGNLCCQFIAFLVTNLLQGAMVFAVFIPMMNLLRNGLINTQVNPLYIFIWMILFGFLLGLGAGILEKYANCVVNKRREPFYWYENSVDARNSILQVVSFPIHYGFLKADKSLPVDPSSEQFYYFATYSAIGILQFCKILYLIMFDHRNIDVACGYSTRTSAPSRGRRRTRNTRSRSPRNHLGRNNEAEEDNTQYYEGSIEEQDRSNGNNTQRREGRHKKSLNGSMKTRGDKSGKGGMSFLGVLLPVELPIIFLVNSILGHIVTFLSYADKLVEDSRQPEASPEDPIGDLPTTSNNMPLLLSSGRRCVSVTEICFDNNNKASTSPEDFNGNSVARYKDKDSGNVFVDVDIIDRHESGDKITTPSMTPLLNKEPLDDYEVSETPW